MSFSRCVSKPWASMLRSPYFTELFLTRSSARPRLLFSCKHKDKLLFFSAPQVQNPHESSSLIAANYLMKFTCNSFFQICGTVCGLMCFVHVPSTRSERELVICNPSTGQSKTINIQIRGFLGYDPTGREFKLLSMNSSSTEHKVLTLGTEKPSWRKIKCCIPHYTYDGCKGICINGILYYPAAENRYSRDSMIICFDVRTEMHSFVKLMKILYYGSTLFNYNGKLASFAAEGSYLISGTNTSFEIWVLDDPEKHEWSKHVFELPPMLKNVDADDKFDFVGVTGTNEILLSPRHPSGPFYIFYYNIERKTIRRVEIQGLDVPKTFVRVNAFVDHVEDVKLMEMFKTYIT